MFELLGAMASPIESSSERGSVRRQAQQAGRAPSPSAPATKRAWLAVCPSRQAGRQSPQAGRTHRGLRGVVARHLLRRGQFVPAEPVGVDEYIDSFFHMKES